MQKNEKLLLPENVYHIYNHANGWENLFSNEGNYAYFLKRYAYFIEPIAETYAYCLMPNHFHLLVKIRDEKCLRSANILFQMNKNIAPSDFKYLSDDQLSKFVSKVFGSLFSSYTQAYNKQQNRRGGLFIQSFKRKRVEREKYFARLIYYIHNNPVHHGFVNSMEDWLFSSYKSYLLNVEKDSDKAKILDWLGGVDAFKTFHKGEVEGLENIKF